MSTTNNILIYLIRILGWWIIRGLSWLLTQLENAFDIVINNLTLYKAETIGLNDGSTGGLYNSLKPVFWALLGIGIIIIGYQLMFNRAKNKAQIPGNVILIVVLVFGMPTLLNSFSSIATSAVDMFSSDTAFAQQIIEDNVTDIKYLDSNDFSGASIALKNALSSSGSTDIAIMIDPAELMKPDNTKNSEIFENRIVYNEYGEASTEATAKGLLGIDMLSSYYYRFKINWLNIYVALTAMIIAVAFSGIKAAKLVYEIAYSGIWLVLIGAVDLSSGQRTKKIFMEIVNMFAVIVAIAFNYKLYMIASAWATSFSGIAYLFFIVGFSFALISGPDIVQKILGIDAGVGGELQKIAGGLYTANMVGQGLKGIGHQAGRLATGAASLTAGGAGVLAGFGGKSVSSFLDNAKKQQEAGKNRAESLNGVVIDGDGRNRNSAAASLDDSYDGDTYLGGAVDDNYRNTYNSTSSPDGNNADGINDNVVSGTGTGSTDTGTINSEVDSNQSQNTDSQTIADSVGSNQSQGVDGSTVDSSVDGSQSNNADGSTIAGSVSSDSSTDESIDNNAGASGSSKGSEDAEQKSAAQDISSNGDNISADNSKGSTGQSAQTADKDTIGGHFKDWVGSTAVGRSAGKVSESFNRGQNTGENIYDAGKRGVNYVSEKIKDRPVKGEIVDNPYTDNKSYTPSKDPIVVEAPKTKSEMDVVPDKEIYSSNNSGTGGRSKKLPGKKKRGDKG